jgi:hypothetical protein
MAGITFDSGTVNTLANAISSQKRLDFDTVREKNRTAEFGKQLTQQEDHFTRANWTEYDKLDEHSRQFDLGHSVDVRNATVNESNASSNAKNAESNRLDTLSSIKKRDFDMENTTRERTDTLVKGGFNNFMTYAGNLDAENGNPVIGLENLKRNDPAAYDKAMTSMVGMPNIVAGLNTAGGNANPARKGAKYYTRTSPATGQSIVAWKNEDGKEVYLSKNGKAIADNTDEAILSFTTADFMDGIGATLRERGLTNEFESLHAVSRAAGADLATEGSVAQMVDSKHTNTKPVSADLQQPDDGRFGPPTSRAGSPNFSLTAGQGNQDLVKAGPITLQNGRASLGDASISANEQGLSFDSGPPGGAFNPGVPQQEQPVQPPAPPPASDRFNYGKNVSGAVGAKDALGTKGEATAIDLVQGKDIGDGRTVTEANKGKLRDKIRQGDPATVRRVGTRLKAFAKSTHKNNTSQSAIGKLIADLSQEGFNGDVDEMHKVVMATISANPDMVIGDKHLEDWGPKEYAQVAGEAIEAENAEFSYDNFKRRYGAALGGPARVPFAVATDIKNSDIVQSIVNKVQSLNK